MILLVNFVKTRNVYKLSEAVKSITSFCFISVSGDDHAQLYIQSYAQNL